MTTQFREIKTFDQLRGLVNKASGIKLLVYFYCSDQKDDEYVAQLVRAVRKYGKRSTKLYLCNLCIYPGLCQNKQSVCLYSEGRKIFQFYGKVKQKIIDISLSRYVN